MPENKESLPTWSIMFIAFLIVSVLLTVLVGLFHSSYVDQANEQSFRMDCIKAHGTWVENVCVID